MTIKEIVEFIGADDFRELNFSYSSENNTMEYSGITKDFAKVSGKWTENTDFKAFSSNIELEDKQKEEKCCKNDENTDCCCDKKDNEDEEYREMVEKITNEAKKLCRIYEECFGMLFGKL